MKSHFLLLLVWFFHLSKAQVQEYYPDPDPLVQQKLEQWQDLKFGLLMHWGPYSQWGVVESWSICPEDVGWAAWAWKKGITEDYDEYRKKYEALPLTFNPTRFNPEKWAAAAKAAGMKYLVFTTKHHDGFNMFDTRYSDYKITGKQVPFSSNPRSDVTKEIFDAFRKEGFWAGAYFSKPDWHNNDYWWSKFPPADRNPNYSINKYPERWKNFADFTRNQLNELASNYGKLDILWLDGGWVRPKTDEEIKAQLLEVYEGSRYARNPQSQDIDMARIVREVRQKQAGLIVVDRAVPGVHQNYLTPEQHIPEKGLPYPWETCMTMANSWSYVPDDLYKPADELIEKLVDIVSKGGNLLLNIGPGPDGEWDPAAYDRLKKIGTWMKINGEGIYNTRMGPSYMDGDRVRLTQNKDGKASYIFLFDFPKDKIILTKLKPGPISGVSMLGVHSDLKWEQTPAGLEIVLPSELQSRGEYVWTLKVEY